MNPEIQHGSETWEEGLGFICRRIQWGRSDVIGITLTTLYEDKDFPALAARAAQLLPSFDINAFQELMVRKHHDYGPKNINKFGLAGVEIRLWDKIARYDNLCQRAMRSGDLSIALNESIDDTLIDIVGYCVIHLMVTYYKFDLPLAADVVEHVPPHLLTLTRESWNPEWELASDSRN